MPAWRFSAVGFLCGRGANPLHAGNGQTGHRWVGKTFIISTSAFNCSPLHFYLVVKSSPLGPIFQLHWTTHTKLFVLTVGCLLLFYMSIISFLYRFIWTVTRLMFGEDLRVFVYFVWSPLWKQALESHMNKTTMPLPFCKVSAFLKRFCRCSFACLEVRVESRVLCFPLLST